jgi:hypothetical protein
VPYQTPSYGGAPIFGLVREMEHVPNSCAQQVDAFFGVPGHIGLFGGARGRTFIISGVLHESDIPTLNADEALIHSYADGIARTLVDTRGRIWFNVVFNDEFETDPRGPRPTDVGWCLAYRAVFHGLT